MATAALNRYTPEEYLALERNAEFRSEYIDGRIIAKSPGAKRPHNLIISALSHHLAGHLMDGPCEVYSNTQRVKVMATTDYVYPDVVVSCDPQFEAGGNDNLLTPVLIAEVLSDSTERHDREKKFSLYKRIDTLREYGLISQREVLVERYVRQGDLWPRTQVSNPHVRRAGDPTAAALSEGPDAYTQRSSRRTRRGVASVWRNAAKVASTRCPRPLPSGSIRSRYPTPPRRACLWLLVTAS